jgi:hypothetical protein
MKHATTRMVFSYWDGLRGERAAPERGEIEPGEIRKALADTFILDLAPDRSAGIRLAGTRLCAFFARELKGERFDALWSEQAIPGPAAFIDLVLDETAGVVAGLAGRTAEGDTVDFEMVLLPVRHRGRPDVRILGALSPALVPVWIGFRPLVAFTTSSMRVLSTARPRDEVELSLASASADDKRRRFVVHVGGRT